MAWGGARTGAGRKRKPLADKLSNDNPGKRPIKTVQFPKKEIQLENDGGDAPNSSFQDGTNGADGAVNGTINADSELLLNLTEVESPANSAVNSTIDAPTFLALNGHEVGDDVPSAVEIYRLLTDFVKSSGCEQLVAPTLVEDFCHLRRSYLEAEYINRTKGRIMGGKRSPYVQMAIDYNKQALAIYDRIWNIIAQNSEKPYDGGKNEFLSLLQNRGF